MYTAQYLRVGRIVCLLLVGLGSMLLPTTVTFGEGQGATQTPLTWPQTFTLAGPLLKTLGFPVTQPGPIQVDIQVQGASVTVGMVGTAGQVAQQQGTGPLQLTYAATAQDVQRSIFWVVSVALTQASVAQNATATVTVSVRHPPIDPSVLQAAMVSATANAQTARAQIKAQGAQHGPNIRAQIDSLNQQQNTQLAQQQAQQRAALMAQIQPALDRLKAGSAVGTRSLQPISAPRKVSAPVIQSLTVNNALITALHVGDPVFINGSGFGTTPGALHFVIGAGTVWDLTVNPAIQPLIWTDTQIFTTVPGPAAGGLPSFYGTIYVKRADQLQSNLQAFTFTPVMDYRTIVVNSPPADAIYTHYNGDDFGAWPPNEGGGIFRANDYCFQSFSNTDQLFVNTHLKNGWQVRGAPTVVTTLAAGGGGGVVPVAFHPLTDSPNVTMVWWMNIGFGCISDYAYTLSIPIQGPLGLPDGIAQP